MSSARLWRKLISCAKILAIMESVQKFANCKKLQIICEESAQNAFGFVNQEPSRFSYLTKQFFDYRIPWSAKTIFCENI